MTDHTSAQALSLRAKALALLQEAQQLDGLKPFLILHSYRSGTTGYLVWGTEALDENTATKVLEIPYEPAKNESLEIVDTLTLEELVGTSIPHRIPDVLDSDPDEDSADDESFPQEIHKALNWMDYEKLKTLLEEYGFAVNAGESEDDLREAVRANLLDGTIPQSRIDTSKC